ncbi:MAG: hypothetical protein NTX25_12875 [Proteobacteria bacterium]|nr:hypothetical protein [Pseudomonadota bacterium]
MDRQSFLALNEAMALRELLDQVLSIDAHWSEEEARFSGLKRLGELLDWSALHRGAKLREISALKQRIPSHPSYHQFMSIFVPIERQHGRAVSDGDFPVASEDRLVARNTQVLPLVLVLENLRSAFNLGSIWRLVECLGVSKIYVTGYTARPDDIKVARAALGTERMVVWEWVPRTQDLFKRLREEAYSILALETSPIAQPMESYTFPQQAVALVFGNERYGLESDVLEACDAVLEISCWGRKNSLNVAVSIGVAVYEMRRQWLSSGFIEGAR